MKSSVRIPKIFVNAEFQRLLWQPVYRNENRQRPFG